MIRVLSPQQGARPYALPCTSDQEANIGYYKMHGAQVPMCRVCDNSEICRNINALNQSGTSRCCPSYEILPHIRNLARYCEGTSTASWCRYLYLFTHVCQCNCFVVTVTATLSCMQFTVAKVKCGLASCSVPNCVVHTGLGLWKRSTYLYLPR